MGTFSGAGGVGGTPAVVLSSSVAAGVATTFIRTDDTIAAFDATNPSTQALGDTAVVGTAAFAARRDHKHVMPAGATAAETTTGTSTALPVTPDGLAGSTVFGTKVLQATAVAYTTNMATGDGQFYFVVPAALNGMDLVRVHARVITAGTTGTCDVQIANVTQAVDMLTTKITIDSAETGSDTAATPAVIDTANDDVVTNDLIRVDVDAIHTTPAKGLIVTLEFRLP